MYYYVDGNIQKVQETVQCNNNGWWYIGTDGKVKVRNNFKKIKFSIFRKSVILTVKVGIADFFGMSKEAIAWVKE